MDEFEEQFKKEVWKVWENTGSSFDFAVECYRRGRLDEAKKADPELNAAVNVIKNKG